MGCASGNSINDTTSNTFAHISDKKIAINSSLKKLHSITDIHNKDVFSFTLLCPNENIFVIGYRDGTIILCSINTSKQNHKILLKKQNAHHTGVSYIQPLPRANTFTTSSLDKSIKFWEYTPSSSNPSLNLIHSIDKAHEGMVNKLILYQNDKLISCSSEDSFIHIWNTSSYELIHTINAFNSVWCITTLVRHQDMLVGSCYGEQCICFWNLNTYELINAVNEIGCYSLNGMIELVNGDVVCINEKGVVDVINVEQFTIVKEINVEGYINGYGSLCLVDVGSFCYCCKGKFIQIEYPGYNVIYKGEYKEEEFDGDAAMVLFEKGKCFVCENHSHGLCFMGYS